MKHMREDKNKLPPFIGVSYEQEKPMLEEVEESVPVEQVYHISEASTTLSLNQ